MTTPIERKAVDLILMGSFTACCDLIEPLRKQFGGIDGLHNDELVGDVLQAALILSTILRIERELGQADYDPFHRQLIQKIDNSVRDRYKRALDSLASYLLQTPPDHFPSDSLPSLAILNDLPNEHLSALVGAWIYKAITGGASLEGASAQQFASGVGDIVYDKEASLMASVVVSDKRLLNRKI